MKLFCPAGCQSAYVDMMGRLIYVAYQTKKQSAPRMCRISPDLNIRVDFIQFRTVSYFVTFMTLTLDTKQTEFSHA